MLSVVLGMTRENNALELDHRRIEGLILGLDKDQNHEITCVRFCFIVSLRKNPGRPRGEPM